MEIGEKLRKMNKKAGKPEKVTGIEKNQTNRQAYNSKSDEHRIL
jgi:hypothetical protein